MDDLAQQVTQPPHPDVMAELALENAIPEQEQNLGYGVIGNCCVAGLVSAQGNMSWLCLPRLDGDPVLNRLLGGTGQFSVTLADTDADDIESHQSYISNTAVLRTEIRRGDGSAIEVIDFAPRFHTRGRIFRPAQTVRIIRSLSGIPRINVDLTLSEGFSNNDLPVVRGVPHS